MDIAFHAVSAGALAYCLGEKRKKQLVYACLIGCVPDMFWAFSHVDPSLRWLYSSTHSLVFNIILCAVLCCFNWRIAFGGLLHILVDAFTHASSTMHMFFPFTNAKLFPGISWWKWPGLILWAALWCLLIITLSMIFKTGSGKPSNSCD